MIDEERLGEVIPSGVSLRLVEPHVYSLHPAGENENSYDRFFGSVYDLVACNRLYNRLVWGYSTAEYGRLCHEALRSSTEGWVLDAGCGSLAFTARTYVEYGERPVVMLDQSIKLLLLAKSRLAKLKGEVPANVVLLHGDALRLPFRPQSFGTIICLNLLHVLEDVRTLLLGLRGMLRDGGTISLTTLIENHRLADRYLHMCARAGELVPRDEGRLLAEFDAVEMPVECRTRGNLAFIHYR
jgi:ubiquinone/menaquinone biosynthesis C-methylase UbiE